MNVTPTKRTVIVTSYRIYGEPISPGPARGPMRTVNDAGEIVEVYYRGDTAEYIPDIPADLDPHGVTYGD